MQKQVSQVRIQQSIICSESFYVKYKCMKISAAVSIVHFVPTMVAGLIQLTRAL